MSLSPLSRIQGVSRVVLLGLTLGLIFGLRPASAEVGWDRAPALPPIRGICPDPGWSTSLSDALDQNLEKIAALGADTVAMAVRAVVANSHRPFLEDPLLDDDYEIARLERMVRRAHGLGLRVILHPQVQLLSGEWRGKWRMEDEDSWKRWFEEYSRWISAWAAFAHRTGVDLLGIGDSLASTSSHSAAWRELVADLREIYDGPLYYAADVETEIESIDWFDAVDLIGVVLDSDLGRRPAPDPVLWSADDEDRLRVADLTNRLAPQVARIRATVLAQDRPAFISRVAFSSVEESWTAAGRDRARSGLRGERDQRRIYRAVFEAFRHQRWFRGTVWWGWREAPTSLPDAPLSESYARSSSPAGKMAEQELRWQFAHPAWGWAAPLVEGRGGIVVSGDSLATQVGVDILRRGGNAADAAIATAMALAVTHPEAGNLGGGGFLLVHNALRHWTGALDFRETAPHAAHESMYQDLTALGDPKASTIGPLAAGIPGSVAGLHALWEREASLPWADLLEPAFRLAVDGFPVGPRTVRRLQEKRAILGRFPSTRAVFFRGGRPLRTGEALRQPALAETLLRLRQEGPGAFYRGSIARDLVRGVEEAGGNWTLEDLAEYRAQWRPPGRVPLEGAEGVQWWTMPPPSSGSVVLGQTMAFLHRQRADLFSPLSVERARAWIESFRLAFADRNQHLADPRFMEVGWRELIHPRYLRLRSRLLPRVGEIGRSEWIGPGHPSRESQDTTHLVVIDARGNCVSLTTTLNALFGSGFVEARTGVLLNDEMDDFDTRPGEPNRYGLIGQGPNVVRGGARMLSSMAPSILLRDGRVWLALGGRGGPRILTAVAQVVYARVFDGWRLDRAVSAPRVHHQWYPDEVRLEEGRIWPGLKTSLDAMGYSTRTAANNGKVHAAELSPDGRFFGVADPRDQGLARCVD